LSEEAGDFLAQAEVRITEQRVKEGIPNAGSNRILDTLIRTAEAIAKLKLHTEITVEDAKRALEIYNQVNRELITPTQEPTDPAIKAYQLILYILQNESNAIPRLFMDLVEAACQKDKAVEWFLKQGPKNRLGSVNSNKRLRRVLELLENHSAKEVKRTQQSPAEFLWVGEEKGDDDNDDDEAADNDDHHHSNNASAVNVGGNDVSTGSTSTTTANGRDLCDQCDPTFFGGTAKEPTIEQTRDQQLQTNDESSQAAREKNSKSHRSQRSQQSKNHYKIPLEEKEYRFLKACEIAMNDYNPEKVANKESGALFTAQDAWYQWGTMFPNERWKIDKVRRVLDKLARKGYVLKRRGDGPDIYYLSWRDDGSYNFNNGNSHGGREQH
jgi:hypothetical protein